MTLFTNGYITLSIPEGFQSVSNFNEFVELYLVDSTKPMTIKVSVSPTIAGLVDIKENIENNFEKGKGELIFSDFVPVNEDIYYAAISTIDDGKITARCNEFLFVKDDNLYSFEFAYPYADAELDDFYLNIIRSLKIGKPKYIVEKESYRLNE
ncbi:hypothetical protein [uncultured Methanobrevibacter sp.]|uniref:hypothetical protein n=1 Tax=uncultured Methanobrevibacter sp. TaxID=253161 RepID=UPI0026187308|nr:hypothetical protein [uncultured Methanobrevibacter sp.]